MADRQDFTPVEELASAPSAPTITTDLPPGLILANQYRIEEKLGGGGMGTVYRCHDLTVQRTVALKALHPHLAGTSKWLLRFQQEARAIARLDHQNIVGVNQMMIHNGVPFIIMDYIKGPNLGDVLSIMGMLSPQRTVKIMAQVADALAHAHENGVVHRDLKPSNIIIVEGSDDFVKILDFGIAKISDPQEPEAAVKLTQTGEVFGSPAYMSPEQVMGKPIDGRSDQYSFGCVLYECLCGTPPFLSTSPMEIMMHHVNDLPVPLSQASLGKEFPLELQHVVMRLLSKDPASRYQSMLSVKNALVRSLSTDAQIFEAEDTVDKRFTPVKERRFPVVGVCASFLIGCAVTALIGYLLFGYKPPAAMQLSPRMGAQEKQEQGLEDAQENGIEGISFKRTTRPNGDYLFDFGKSKLGKISFGNHLGLDVPVLRMQHIIRIPKEAVISLMLPSKTFVYQPTLLELFHDTKLESLTIGLQGMEEVADDSDIDAAGRTANTNALQRACVYVQPLKSLQVLNIDSIELNPLGLKYLDLDNLTNLSELRIAKTTLDGKDLANVKALQRLNALDVRGMKNVRYVTRAIQGSKNLVTYNVEKCGITDLDLQPISKIANLLVLIITGNSSVTGHGLNYLANKHLQQISAGGTAVAPDSDSLPVLMKMKSLTCLYLPKQLWPDADRSKLIKALPGCQVKFE